MNEQNLLNNHAKLQWACRRGMLELDVLLGNFLSEAYSKLNLADKQSFVELLNYSDPELLGWLLGNDTPQDEKVAKITQAIRIHARNRF